MMAGRDSRAWSPLVPEEATNHPTRNEVPVSAPGLRVLVVDNDMRAADSLEQLLHAGGYADTRVAYSAHGALEIAHEFRPTVVLIELDMRDIGSYELGKTLRERAQLERVRLVAVTDSRAHNGRERARDAGFERYLLKPVSAAALSALLTPSE
jgi:CheY-like chemotaxis protein